MSCCQIFVGPTAYGARLPTRPDLSFELKPPAERGTFEDLVAGAKSPGVVALVDGRFGDKLAVSHRELRHLLEGGWQVWGLSSLGAIRAVEMQALGMRGFGLIYEQFRKEPEKADDEVAVLHDPSPPFRPTTHPLVHIREAMRFLVQSELVDQSEANEILDHLRTTWFGNRSLEIMIEHVRRVSGDQIANRASVLLIPTERFEVKRHDLEAFVHKRPWLK
jgi:hypothetical protein